MAVASVGTTRTNDVRYDTLYYLMSFYVMLCHVILCHVTLNVWCHRSTLRVLSSCSIPFPPPCSPSFSSFIPYLSTTPHPPPSFPPLILLHYSSSRHRLAHLRRTDLLVEEQTEKNVLPPPLWIAARKWRWTKSSTERESITPVSYPLSMPTWTT